MFITQKQFEQRQAFARTPQARSLETRYQWGENDVKSLILMGIICLTGLVVYGAVSLADVVQTGDVRAMMAFGILGLTCLIGAVITEKKNDRRHYKEYDEIAKRLGYEV